MRFALVIPALNEEQVIAQTLRRALAVRPKVLAQTPVTDMQVIFVNDGSTDRTQDIVDQPEFADVLKIRFEKNRGYGAAIKAGFAATDAELLGFMDADGTCDPEFAVHLINRLLETGADVALARRLETGTQMPWIRRLGNRLFALLLGLMSGHTDITDTASGFRVLRRSSLKYLTPLPDGLHYTPTMSAICLLDPRLKIVEVPGMYYRERQGRSKLRVLRDGLRFLWTILFAACCYSPIKTMLGSAAFVGILTALAAGLLAWRQSASAAIYLALAGLLIMIVLLATGVAAHEMNFLLIGPRRRVGILERTLQWLLNYRRLILSGLTLCLAALIALILVLDQITGPPAAIYASLVLLAILGAVMCMGGIIVRVIWAVGEKQKALLEPSPLPAENLTRSSVSEPPQPGSTRISATETPVPA